MEDDEKEVQDTYGLESGVFPRFNKSPKIGGLGVD
jgi:hypothetical protein